MRNPCQFCERDEENKPIQHKVAVPSVHLNGSPGQNLVEDLTEALSELGDAIRGIANAAPNARDYYIHGNDYVSQVMREHTSRLERLHAVKDELMEMRDHAQAQVDFRDKARGNR